MQDYIWRPRSNRDDTVLAFCEQGNEASGSIKERGFIDHLNYYWILKDSAP
jgi:hypothetical protein